MAKVSVKICMGTTCFIMGANELQELQNIIPARYKDKVDVTTTKCLNSCKEGSNYAQAPYVQVNEDLINEATVDKVIAAIDKNLGED